MAYTYILVMSGPFKNALRNANVLVNSLNCGQEIVIKQTKAMLKTIFAPLIAIVDIMRDILKALKEFARMMKQAFIAIRDLFLEIINAIKVVFQWLQSIVSICSNKYGSPYERCNKAFDEAIEDCRAKMGIFKFLCYIVSAIKYVCEIARIVDLLCIISKAIKTGIIDPLKERKLPSILKEFL
ncbi:DC-STAMP domain-containing protein 2 [Trichonephila clavata]|uniref:DC-STAMP domain-containing protein 2 n=1 Tax=Trichonephila clavata TaxID=2740835 RepID=A0A8X6KQI7_TRICU|nr:DC-STAMP domain-containing protein 2 [Trichonephila clavata]